MQRITTVHFVQEKKNYRKLPTLLIYQKHDMSDSGTCPALNIRTFDELSEASKFVARKIAKLIEEKNQTNSRTVLGLATGNTPRLLYQELIKIHQKEGLSFRNVVTFNLDEYFPMKANDNASYHYFMQHELFNHIDIDSKNCHIPKGDISASDVNQSCKNYEQQIAVHGGIDLQILGLGQNGHIGFNEPGSPIESLTRLVKLEDQTRLVNSSEFEHIDSVPHHAITMGIQTILQAKEIYLLASGEKKSKIIKQTLEHKMNPNVPASLLFAHTNCHFILDKKAAALL